MLRGHCDPLQGVDEILNDNENRVNPAIQGNIQDFQGQEDHLQDGKLDQHQQALVKEQERYRNKNRDHSQGWRLPCYLF